MVLPTIVKGVLPNNVPSRLNACAVYVGIPVVCCKALDIVIIPLVLEVADSSLNKYESPVALTLKLIALSPATDFARFHTFSIVIPLY